MPQRCQRPRGPRRDARRARRRSRRRRAAPARRAARRSVPRKISFFGVVMPRNSRSGAATPAICSATSRRLGLGEVAVAAAGDARPRASGRDVRLDPRPAPPAWRRAGRPAGARGRRRRAAPRRGRCRPPARAAAGRSRRLAQTTDCPSASSTSHSRSESRSSGSALQLDDLGGVDDADQQPLVRAGRPARRAATVCGHASGRRPPARTRCAGRGLVVSRIVDLRSSPRDGGASQA